MTLSVCMLALAAGCSSSSKTSRSASTTTATGAPTSTTADPDLTPNSIPFVVGEQAGLPNNWLVTLLKIHLAYAAPSLPQPPAGQQYVGVDMRMENQGPASHAVDANALFTMVDGSHKSHYVVPVPGHPNGIDGPYPAGTTRRGLLVFQVPTGKDLGLILYGPKIGTQVTYFAIVPPTVAGDSG
jgi:hypothetical protein